MILVIWLLIISLLWWSGFRIRSHRNHDGFWGTNQYTHDSDISTAAVHAGLVAVGERQNCLYLDL